MTRYGSRCITATASIDTRKREMEIDRAYSDMPGPPNIAVVQRPSHHLATRDAYSNALLFFI